jgi:hypothetical protein
MGIDLKILDVNQPALEFGSPGQFFDPKNGLLNSGPFDLRFGTAKKSQLQIGIVGTKEMIEKTHRWLERISHNVSPNLKQPYNLEFPGFSAAFHAGLTTNPAWVREMDEKKISGILANKDPYIRFQEIIKIYESEFKIISNRSNKPDTVLCCLTDEVIKGCWSVTRNLTKIEKKLIFDFKQQNKTSQLSLFGEPVEEVEEDLMFRDLRRALKAVAIKHNIPIQITTNNLLLDSMKGQDTPTRAWNFSVALYYKCGGIPWRLKIDGPETCFVGISFNHFKTTHRHLVRSSIAQAFSNKGDGFAIKGENVAYDPSQGKQVHLSREQAFRLGTDIINTYKDHTGLLPPRIVLHKTSVFNFEEQEGFKDAFIEIPVVEFVNLMPTSFRLLRIGNYPPKRGTLCQVGHKNYFFTTGFMPEIMTYPGPHIPSPVNIQVSRGTDVYNACKELLGLTRMNWNTAGITSGQPVTFFFARNIGGIISELKDEVIIPTEFKYFM